MKYTAGYKYQLAGDEWTFIDIHPHEDLVAGRVTLCANGWLHITAGYAWDGASCAVDTQSFMRGSLIHDALYELMRKGKLPASCKSRADEVLVEICKADGMSSMRCWWVLKGLQIGGRAATLPENRKKVLQAP